MKSVIGFPEGFAGQRFAVVPRELRAGAGGPRHLGVAMAGWFPHAVRHAHSRPNGSAECVVVVCFRGAGWCHLNGVEHAVSAGQALVLPAGRPHAYGASDDNPWTIGWLHLFGEGVEELTTTQDGQPAAPVITSGHLEKIALLIDEIITYIELEMTPTSLAAASGAASHLASVLNLGSRATLDAHDPVQLAVAFLASKLDRPVSVGEVATESGLSRSQISARFRRETGASIQAYHTRLRLARSCLFLENTSLSVRDVAFKTGYADPYYFSRIFSSTYGMSPRSYRRRSH